MELLVGGGYSVDEAANAAEALARLRSAQGRYDVVFITDTIEDNPGQPLVGELRKLHAEMPVLLASKDRQEELLEVFKKDRCTGIISKPYTGTKLLEALAALGVRCRGR
jgi:CheY-like chemotaxis protein